MSDKVTKILIVIFLTLLIWAWAFLAQEQEETFHGSLELSQQTDPSLLVSFSAAGIEYGSSIPLKLNFVGTPDKIAELAKRAKLTAQDDPDHEQLDYPYNPADDGFTETKIYTLDLLRFLQDHSKTKQLALTLQSCEIADRPIEQIDVNVEVLEKKECTIRCLDENDVRVPEAMMDPPTIEMYVRKDAPAEATVRLSAEQMDRARTESVFVKPSVMLGTAGRRSAVDTVAVSLPQLSDLNSQPFQTTLPIGIVMSQKLQNEYSVVIEEPSIVRSAIQILATDEAFAAYQSVPFPLLIEVRDSDASSEMIPPKTVIYNFPTEYVRSGEIKLADPAGAKTRQVNIILIPITPSTN
ncbi:MAG: hypothetical protein ACYSUT_04265 [Planctomycetota bacterium]|jgi:hypothetical protein